MSIAPFVRSATRLHARNLLGLERTRRGVCLLLGLCGLGVEGAFADMAGVVSRAQAAAAASISGSCANTKAHASIRATRWACAMSCSDGDSAHPPTRWPLLASLEWVGHLSNRKGIQRGSRINYLRWGRADSLCTLDCISTTRAPSWCSCAFRDGRRTSLMLASRHTSPRDRDARAPSRRHDLDLAQTCQGAARPRVYLLSCHSPSTCKRCTVPYPDSSVTLKTLRGL